LKRIISSKYINNNLTNRTPEELEDEEEDEEDMDVLD
jgi:hypothetical protein